MLLKILHRTTYRYAQRAHDSFNEVRLRPFDEPWQKRLSYELVSEPTAAGGHSYTDLYLNHVDVLQLPDVHMELAIEAQSLVETAPRPKPTSEDAAALRLPKFAYEAYDFLMDTSQVPLTPEIWRCAVDVHPNGLGDLWADACVLSDWVHDAFEYAPGATQANTTASEALAARRGVCQDFAHVLLGLCRSLKMPARYVSGYFFNEHFDPNAEGSEASHAWVDVFLPNQGWRGLDPTHRRPVDERYVSVAVGRDYNDIRPVSGAYRGALERSMEIHVRITKETAHETTL